MGRPNMTNKSEFSAWKEYITLVSYRSNTYIKISGIAENDGANWEPFNYWTVE